MNLCEIYLVEYDEIVDRNKIKELKRTGFKAIITKSMGFDNIDLKACKKHGLKFRHLPDYCSSSVAEHALYLTLAVAQTPLELSETTALVIGARGNIGRKICELLTSNGIATFQYDTVIPGQDNKTLLEFLPLVDFIYMAVPLNAETRNFFKKEHFEAMERKPILIDVVGRQGLISESLLVAALEKGQLSGLGMDYIPSDKLLLSTDLNTLFTPHVAANAFDAQKRKQESIDLLVRQLTKGKAEK